jgi:hypothetical protein
MSGVADSPPLWRISMFKEGSSFVIFRFDGDTAPATKRLSKVSSRSITSGGMIASMGIYKHFAVSGTWTDKAFAYRSVA